MIKIKLDTRGAIADINRIVKDSEQQIKIALVDFGTKVEMDAKRDAPADEGKLRNSINTVYKNGQVAITVTADYAAYMEFGTRKFAAKYVATLPQEWKTYAATFKGGTGGGFERFIKAIMAWVKRKGIDDKAAYPIALKILREGVRPQPFLYPAVKKHTPELQKDIQNIFK